MRCASCGAVCQVLRHPYYEGLLQNPKRTWTIDMPLYYLGDRPFCTPVCATLGAELAPLQSLS